MLNFPVNSLIDSFSCNSPTVEFSELKKCALETLRFYKPIPPLLAIVNVYEAAPSSVWKVNPTSATLQHIYLMFG